MAIQFQNISGQHSANSSPPSPFLNKLSQILPEGSYTPKAKVMELFTQRVFGIVNNLKRDFRLKNSFALFSQLGEDLRQLGYDFPPRVEQIESISREITKDDTFGCLRKTPINWSLTGPFLAKVCSYGPRDSFFIWEGGFPPEVNNTGMGAIWEKINGKVIELTRFHVFSTNEHKFNSIVSMNLRDDFEGVDNGNMSRVLQECDRLFLNILNARDPDVIQRDIASAHWLMLQASPWSKGNSEAAAIIATALSDYKCFTLGDWIPNVHLIAMTTPLEEFIALYPSLREIKR